MNSLLQALLTAGIPTIAVLIAIIRDESATNSLAARFITLETGITSLEQRPARLGQITMSHNTDIARLKDKAGLG